MTKSKKNPEAQDLRDIIDSSSLFSKVDWKNNGSAYFEMDAGRKKSSGVIELHNDGIVFNRVITAYGKPYFKKHILERHFSKATKGVNFLTTFFASGDTVYLPAGNANMAVLSNAAYLGFNNDIDCVTRIAQGSYNASYQGEQTNTCSSGDSRTFSVYTIL